MGFQPVQSLRGQNARATEFKHYQYLSLRAPGTADCASLRWPWHPLAACRCEALLLWHSVAGPLGRYNAPLS